MTAVRNHVAVPFFDRVPQRAKGIVLKTFDSIVDRSSPQREAYHFFFSALKQCNVEGPSSEEFANWYNRVSNGLIERPHPSEVVPFAAAAEPHWKPVHDTTPRSSHVVAKPCSVACDFDQGNVEAERLRMARAIVVAAHTLNEAKLAAGYSPASIHLDDTIVQQALADLLTAEASNDIMDADVHMTPGNKLADLLLGEDSDEIDDKIIGCLTMDMQPELCRIFSRPNAIQTI